MYPRFGMTYVAIEAAQARARAAQLQQHDLTPTTRAAVFSDAAHNDEAGALWRMGAIITVVVAVAGTIAWFAA